MCFEVPAALSLSGYVGQFGVYRFATDPKSTVSTSRIANSRCRSLVHTHRYSDRLRRRRFNNEPPPTEPENRESKHDPLLLLGNHTRPNRRPERPRGNQRQRTRAAWEQLTSTCETPTPDSGVCDCAIAQVGAALDAFGRTNHNI